MKKQSVYRAAFHHILYRRLLSKFGDSANQGAKSAITKQRLDFEFLCDEAGIDPNKLKEHYSG